MVTEGWSSRWEKLLHQTKATSNWYSRLRFIEVQGADESVGAIERVGG